MEVDSFRVIELTLLYFETTRFQLHQSLANDNLYGGQDIGVSGTIYRLARVIPGV